MNLKYVSTAILALSVAASVTAGCGKTERWCELDRGDQLAENWHCEQGEEGYEWEPDHDKPKHKKKPNKSKRKATRAAADETGSAAAGTLIVLAVTG